MNPGLPREPWDRTRPDEDWTADDPAPRKPASRSVIPDPEPQRAVTPVRHETNEAPSEKKKIYNLPRNIRMFWKSRPCWICGYDQVTGVVLERDKPPGVCEHREFDVALAYVTDHTKHQVIFRYLGDSA